jgi:hypothetical protein
MYPCAENACACACRTCPCALVVRVLELCRCGWCDLCARVLAVGAAWPDGHPEVEHRGALRCGVHAEDGPRERYPVFRAWHRG